MYNVQFLFSLNIIKCGKTQDAHESAHSHSSMMIRPLITHKFLLDCHFHVSLFKHHLNNYSCINDMKVMHIQRHCNSKKVMIKMVGLRYGSSPFKTLHSVRGKGTEIGNSFTVCKMLWQFMAFVSCFK